MWSKVFHCSTCIIEAKVKVVVTDRSPYGAVSQPITRNKSPIYKESNENRVVHVKLKVGPPPEQITKVKWFQWDHIKTESKGRLNFLFSYLIALK